MLHCGMQCRGPPTGSWLAPSPICTITSPDQSRARCREVMFPFQGLTPQVLPSAVILQKEGNIISSKVSTKDYQAKLSLHQLLIEGVSKTASEKRMFTNLSQLTHFILLTTVQMSLTLRMAHLTPKKTCSAVANLSLEARRDRIFPATPTRTKEPWLCSALGRAEAGATLPQQAQGVGWRCPRSGDTALAHRSSWCSDGSPKGWK